MSSTGSPLPLVTRPTLKQLGLGNRSLVKGWFQPKRFNSTNKPPAEAPPAAKPPVHTDGMPRFPSTSAGGLLRGLDYFGTVVFALGGSVTAGLAGMDLLGCTIVGTVTAVGGGTVRDLLLGNFPVFWMLETEYVVLSLACAWAGFFGWDYLHEHWHLEENSDILRWWDACGVGAFSVIGAQNGLRAGLHPAVAVVCGMITATFGGMIRDVLCQKPPRILHSQSEVYATTALIGAAAYTAARGLPPAAKIGLGFSAAVASRYAAWTYDIRLPNWGGRTEK